MGDKRHTGFSSLFLNLMENVVFVFFAVMVIIVFINVIGRFFFQAGITEAEELAKILFVWLVFIGAVLLSWENKHIYVDIVVNILPQAPRKIVLTVANLCVSIILLVLVRQGTHFVTTNIGLAMPMTKIPVALVHSILPVSAALMLVINQYRLYAILKGRE